MAGKVKHMERSHRSNGSNQAVFNSFESRAMKTKVRKEHKKTLDERFKSLFHRSQNK